MCCGMCVLPAEATVNWVSVTWYWSDWLFCNHTKKNKSLRVSYNLERNWISWSVANGSIPRSNPAQEMDNDKHHTLWWCFSSCRMVRHLPQKILRQQLMVEHVSCNYLAWWLITSSVCAHPPFFPYCCAAAASSGRGNGPILVRIAAADSNPIRSIISIRFSALIMHSHILKFPTF